MNAPFHFFLLIRLAVGLIFLTQGILKYIDPNMGVVRFTKIGFQHPYFTAHFVGAFETVCGALGAARPFDESRRRPTSDRDLHRHCDDKDPGIIPAEPGVLVHERCADGLCDVLFRDFSGFSARRLLGSGCPARLKHAVRCRP